jgi:hypothetical protein
MVKITILTHNIKNLYLTKKIPELYFLNFLGSKINVIFQKQTKENKLLNCSNTQIIRTYDFTNCKNINDFINVANKTDKLINEINKKFEIL